MNELVKLLYPSIYMPSEYLHQASIQVRYGQGLRYQLQKVKESLDVVQTAVDGGLAA